MTVQKAALLLEAGRAPDALGLLSTVLASAPDDAEALRLMAQALLMQDMPHQALAAALRAVALDPDSEWSHRLVSVASEEVGALDQAVLAAHEAVRLAPWAADTRQRLAYALTARAGQHSHFPTFHLKRRRRLRDARRAAERSAELAPQASGSHFALGYVYQASGRHRLAVKAYKQTLTLDPQHAAAHNNLAALGFSNFALSDIARSLRASLVSDPHGVEAQANLESLAVRMLWVEWFLVSVIDAVLLGVCYVFSWPWRSLLAIVGLGLAALVGRRLLGLVTPAQVRHLRRRLVHRWPVWILGPLLGAALVVALGFVVLPTAAALNVGLVYIACCLVAVRIG